MNSPNLYLSARVSSRATTFPRTTVSSPPSVLLPTRNYFYQTAFSEIKALRLICQLPQAPFPHREDLLKAGKYTHHQQLGNAGDGRAMAVVTTIRRYYD